MTRRGNGCWSRRDVVLFADQPASGSNMPTTTLRLIDPEKNKWRFYRLEVRVDLFGQWCLIREWGRIGRSGQIRTTPFPTAAQAEAALGSLRSKKERRGYLDRPDCT